MLPHTQLWSPWCCSSSPSVAWSCTWETLRNKIKFMILNIGSSNLFRPILRLRRLMLLLDNLLNNCLETSSTEIRLETIRSLQVFTNINGSNPMLKKWAMRWKPSQICIQLLNKMENQWSVEECLKLQWF